MIYNLPKSLLEAAKNHLHAHLLLEGKIDDLKKQNPHMSNEIDAYSALDTTPTKKFVPWLVSQHKKGNVTPTEPSIKETLEGFEKYKNKHGIKDHSGMSYGDVKNSVQIHLGTSSTKKEQEQKENEEGLEEIPQVKVFHVKTKKSAQNVYGGGHELGGNHTNWCVSARGNDNMFGNYGDLYTIHVPNDPSSPYAYHPAVNSVTDRFNNNDDKSKMFELPIEDAIRRNPALHYPIHQVRKINQKKSEIFNSNTEKLKNMNTSSTDITDIYHHAFKNEYRNHIYETILHPNVTSEVLDHAAKHLDYDPLLTSEIALHNKTKPSTLNAMLDNPDARIRREAIAGGTGHIPNLKKALNDTDSQVVDFALSHPKMDKEYALTHFQKNHINMNDEVKNTYKAHFEKWGNK